MLTSSRRIRHVSVRAPVRAPGRAPGLAPGLAPGRALSVLSALRRFSFCLSLCAPLSALTSACGSSADAEGTYVIEFPSSSAVLATESVDVDVYEAADPSLCINLTERARTNQELPDAIARVARIDPCALASGDGSLRVSSGERAILVRANRGGRAYLVGCSRFVAEPGFVANVTVSLLPNVAAPPASTCASMKARCEGAC